MFTLFAFVFADVSICILFFSRHKKTGAINNTRFYSLLIN